MNKERIRELAYKYALLNAFLHNGKAVAKAVLGKIIAEDPELKRRIPEVIQVIEEVVKESERYPKLLGKKPSVEEKKLPPLPNVDKYKQVVTRFAPNPDFVLHIGNARPAILSYEYAR
ncbi:MAG: glutamate--tRNA ligase, partial [Thermofilum sp. ex4484_79]